MGALATNNEHAFVAALMCLPAESCVSLTDLCDPKDFEDAELRFIVDVVRRLAQRGAAFDPPAVMAEIRRGGGLDGERIRAADQRLADLATNVDHPLWAHHYLVAVVEASVRRTVLGTAIRLNQAAAIESLDSLPQLLASEFKCLRDNFDRLSKIRQSNE